MGPTIHTFTEEHLGSITLAEDIILQTNKHNHHTRNRHHNHSDHLSLLHKIHQHNTTILTIIHTKVVHHPATMVRDRTIIKMALVQIVILAIVVMIHRMAMQIMIETMDKTIVRTKILRGKFRYENHRRVMGVCVCVV